MAIENFQTTCIYQIYPRSFMDSNGDGIGDLRGIILKLDYLKALGVEMIWLSPVYKSPMDDNGYDISDYQDIAPEFGTLADMDALILEAKKRNIRIMMDLVVNHTSDEHPWFISAKSSKESPYRDFYIFREPKFPVTHPEDMALAVPSAIGSIFGGSAWQYSHETDSYYFHLFSKRQPDLNWENPKVSEAIFDMMNWWLDRGVGGFRMDVIDLIGKEVDKGILGNGPRLHELLKEMNEKTLRGKSVVTVGETWGATPEIAKLYSSPERNELSMVFQFEHVTAFTDPVLGKWKATPVDFQVIKDILSKWQTELASDGWNSLFWNNHDLPRAVSKYGLCDTEAHRVLSAKMLATMLHGLKGSPYIYQGEELGMTNVAFENISDYQDIEILNAYKGLVLGDPEFSSDNDLRLSHEEMMAGIYENGRDNARTPMHWDDSENAGFTTGTPWLKANPNYRQINALTAMNDPDSIFHHYRRLIGFRKQYEVLTNGDFRRYLPSDTKHFVYTRENESEVLLIICNHSKEHTVLRLPKELSSEGWSLLLSNYGSDFANLESLLRLRPFESLMLYRGK